MRFCFADSLLLVPTTLAVSSACGHPADSPSDGSGNAATVGEASSGSGTTSNAATTAAGTGGSSEGATDADTTATGSSAGGTPNTVVPGAEGFDCTPSDGSSVSLKLTEVVSGLDAPTGVYGPPGENDRLLVLLQSGRIEIVRGNSVTGTFLDLSEKIEVEDAIHEERGLLGMAFHPEFQTNGKFFVVYTTGNAENGDLMEHISEFTASGDTADAGSEREFEQFPQPQNNHNGGGMAIGLDGYLYVAIGDGGWVTEGADLYHNAQNPSTPLGALLRFTLDGAPAPGNYPGGAPEVWDIGLRNPWRITTDGCTGDLYIADVGYADEGEDTSPPTEEVNIEAPGGGQKNYGWPVMEGAVCRETGCDASTYVVPMDSYPTLAGNAIIGGYVYRGNRIPGLRGTYLYADYTMGAFWAFEYQNGAVVNSRQISRDINPDGIGAVISFGQDSTGEMYVIGWSDGGLGEEEADNVGTIYRIDAE